MTERNDIENPRSEPEAPVAQETAPVSESRAESRRKMLVRGLGAAPVLMTLGSRSAMATWGGGGGGGGGGTGGGGCTVSGMHSVNPSLTTTCMGYSSGKWKNSYSGIWPSPYEHDKKFKYVYTGIGPAIEADARNKGVIQSWEYLTMWDVICGSTVLAGYSPGFLANMCTAVLNAQYLINITGGPAAYGYTPSEIISMVESGMISSADLDALNNRSH